MWIDTPRVMAGILFIWAGNLASVDVALAFHVGGIGSCDSCHSMHNPRDKEAMAGRKSQSLLLATDPSSVCLNCHAGPGSFDRPSVLSPDGSAMTPGGDFYWLTRTFTWGGGVSSGDSHGHNVIAQDFNLGEDLQITQSPGGSYPSAALSCVSCHDPHGEVRGGVAQGTPPVSVSGSYGELPANGTVPGNYRLLGDSFYEGGRAAKGFHFNYDAPVARQNASFPFGESDASHVDYGNGMSDWCANCHEGYLRNEHGGLTGGFMHPTASGTTLTSEIVNIYNTYIRTGDMTGISSTSYLQFVPFERGTSNSQQLNPTSRGGPNTNSRVMCLTCHRAHASAFEDMGRWDLEALLLAESHPRAGDGGVTGNDVFYSYYGRNVALEFGSEQGPFCEKCHGPAEMVIEPGLEPLPAGATQQGPMEIFKRKRRF